MSLNSSSKIPHIHDTICELPVWWRDPTSPLTTVLYGSSLVLLLLYNVLTGPWRGGQILILKNLLVLCGQSLTCSIPSLPAAQCPSWYTHLNHLWQPFWVWQQDDWWQLSWLGEGCLWVQYLGAGALFREGVVQWKQYLTMVWLQVVMNLMILNLFYSSYCCHVTVPSNHTFRLL